MFQGFDYDLWINGTQTERLRILPIAQENGKDGYLQVARDLSLKFELAMPQEQAMGIRYDIAFFQVVRSVLVH